MIVGQGTSFTIKLVDWESLENRKILSEKIVSGLGLRKISRTFWFIFLGEKYLDLQRYWNRLRKLVFSEKKDPNETRKQNLQKFYLRYLKRTKLYSKKIETFLEKLIVTLDSGHGEDEFEAIMEDLIIGLRECLCEKRKGL
jgi:hypothetical protein